MNSNSSKQVRPSEAQECIQFKRGKCYRGGNCKYAHDNGNGDGGQLRSNRGDILGSEGHVMRSREKLCAWFMDGRRCPYGDKCSFSHSSAEKVGGSLGVHRESAAITLVDTRASVKNQDADQMQRQKRFWKTRLCHSWERTGSCAYGFNCRFAHGEAETHRRGSLPPQVSGKACTAETLANAAEGAAPSKKGYKISYEQLENGRKRLIWWENVEQVNGIYADWIDTEPPVRDTSDNQDA